MNANAQNGYAFVFALAYGRNEQVTLIFLVIFGNSLQQTHSAGLFHFLPPNWFVVCFSFVAKDGSRKDMPPKVNKTEVELKKLTKLEGNKTCADCSEKVSVADLFLKYAAVHLKLCEYVM